MPPELPFEIWWKILEYLPSDACAIRLRTVNRLFLQIARKLLYGKLTINQYEEQTEHLLKGISSLSLGHHVHSLCIQPWDISSTSQFNGPVERVLSSFDFVQSLFDSGYPKRKAKTLVQHRMHEQIQLLAQTVKKLEDVREYIVDWDVEKPYRVHLFTAALALPRISPFGRTLTKLTVRVPTDRLVRLARLSLPALEELDIHLITLLLSEKYIDGCLEHVVVFINKVAQTLRSLSISSTHLSHNLNLSTFFRNLCMLPFLHLHSFTLSVPYDGYHLPNETNGPDVLRAFLQQSRNIRHLKLSSCSRTPHLRSSSIASRPNGSHGKYWIQRALESPELANALTSLTSLELTIRPLLGDQSGPSLAFISAVAHQLESLVLTDESLTPEEVRRVVNALVPASACRSTTVTSPVSLVHLSLHLQYLSASILNLLAARVDRLESLKLTFNDIKPSSYSDENRTEISVKCESVSLREELSSCASRGTYEKWNLSSLTLFGHLSYCPCGSDWSISLLEQAFRKCIPSLETYSFCEMNTARFTTDLS
ncbi:hypothetical protein GYMLUDRAFT_47879 [Collybiopsis luxurians FD-317 M1]|uniref:F-box domain-containing protein n=1 Tax=Collybiopsis luxurians FD-317 M1 TaxID=944289 RepID=A0A0D0CJU4_9AGAR|nr:hypothetical protein GYMLUDRAFT_47879 [Collybiopsis luxurians FD-317 M1]